MALYRECGPKYLAPQWAVCCQTPHRLRLCCLNGWELYRINFLGNNCISNAPGPFCIFPKAILRPFIDSWRSLCSRNASFQRKSIAFWHFQIRLYWMHGEIWLKVGVCVGGQELGSSWGRGIRGPRCVSLNFPKIFSLELPERMRNAGGIYRTTWGEWGPKWFLGREYDSRSPER